MENTFFPCLRRCRVTPGNRDIEVVIHMDFKYLKCAYFIAQKRSSFSSHILVASNFRLPVQREGWVGGQASMHDPIPLQIHTSRSISTQTVCHCHITSWWNTELQIRVTKWHASDVQKDKMDDLFHLQVCFAIKTMHMLEWGERYREWIVIES